MATYGDLTTAEAAIAWVQGSADAPLTAADIATITNLVTPASEFIRTYLNRNIAPADYEELRDGLGNDNFVFANFPVTAISLVVINGVTIPAVPHTPPAPPGMAVATFLNGQAGYLFTPTRLVIRGYRVPRLPLCVTLRYTAGYATVPADLAQACLEIINLEFVERQRAGLISETAAGIGSQTYKVTSMPSRTQLDIDNYRAVAPVSGYSRVLAVPSPAEISITILPLFPTIPSTTPLGTVVAILTGQWSDGRSFQGNFTFAPPNFDDSGVFAITQAAPGAIGYLIINPSGPGVSAAGGSAQNATVVANDPPL